MNGERRPGPAGKMARLGEDEAEVGPRRLPRVASARPACAAGGARRARLPRKARALGEAATGAARTAAGAVRGRPGWGASEPRRQSARTERPRTRPPRSSCPRAAAQRLPDTTASASASVSLFSLHASLSAAQWELTNRPGQHKISRSRTIELG